MGYFRDIHITAIAVTFPFSERRLQTDSSKRIQVPLEQRGKSGVQRFVRLFDRFRARLWENWRDPESGEWLRTCTIITGEPNELVAQIHPRMPVILPEQHHAAWLGETDDGNLNTLLVPYPADQMRVWEISPRVNSPNNDDVNTGSDRDDGKRLTRFDVAIRHIGFAGSNDESSGRKRGSRDKALGFS